MIGLLGKKKGMTQIFDENGKQIPVTVLEVGPCHVSQVKTAETDGYSAIQIAYGSTKASRLTKAENGHLAKANLEAFSVLREVRGEAEGLSVGTELTVSNFEVGDYVDIEGISKGRGYQGVVKRHGFKGGEKAHGSKHGREVGSTGQSAYPSRVIKGKKMPGQMGNKKTLVQNLYVVKIDTENNLIAVHGAVPGHNDGYLFVSNALKKGSAKQWQIDSPSTGSSDDDLADKVEDASVSEVPVENSEKNES